MSVSTTTPRFPTAAAIKRLTALLRLREGGQDWELEVADDRRVEEFVDTYESAALDDDERFTLMALIVASYDEMLRNGADGDGWLWARLRRHLLDRFDLHGYTVRYWSLPEVAVDDLDHVFPFTGRAREIMTAVSGPRELWPTE